MRTYNCSEIFKEGTTLTMKEVNAIMVSSPSFKFYEDNANGIVAFALEYNDEEKADELVDNLNKICEEKGLGADWYLGDNEEEYVFVN
jgi:ACT domain-containing protein